jgi:hypothetical protein
MGHKQKLILGPLRLPASTVLPTRNREKNLTEPIAKPKEVLARAENINKPKKGKNTK